MSDTSDDKLSRRERKKRETRRRLMESALRLFQEQGYDATTVEQIAAAADVAKGTFFNYFQTKEAIIPSLIEWRLQRLHEVLEQARAAGESPIARLKRALVLIASEPLVDPALARHLFATRHYRLRHRPMHVLTSLFADQVRQAQEAGEIRADLDPVYVGGLIRALFLQQVMVWYHGARPASSLPDLLTKTVDVLLEGIAGPQWRPTP